MWWTKLTYVSFRVHVKIAYHIVYCTLMWRTDFDFWSILVSVPAVVMN